MRNSKILPLRPIDLKSRPQNHRALAWSCDAELAVAADDCVTIYLPAFPFLDPAQPLSREDYDDDDSNQTSTPSATRAAAADGENGMGILPANLPTNDEGDDDLGSGDDEEEDDDDDDDDDEEGMFGHLQHRDDDDDDDAQHREGGQQQGQGRERAHIRQYADETARVLWVSYPALHPELNLHVWEAAGKAMPLIRSGGNMSAAVGDERGLFGDGPARGAGSSLVEGEGEQHAQGEMEVDVMEEEEELLALTASQEANSHPGAGTGVIGGAGSSLNHVVAVEWSPSGLGRNLRPVLAVLTGCGSLAVYGEGSALPFGSNAKPSRVMGRGQAAVRDLQSWLVLWAVGENFVVPGQEEFGYGEFVKAFAWCQEVGAGKALLGYINDLREIVILSVGTTFRKTEHGLDEAIWNVQEIARLETGGPHEQPDTCDPDYIPSGSSYCLRWSPWTKGKETWSCLLSYMDRNYVGFRKITVNAPNWNPRKAPTIVCESTDWDGRCIHLGTDAFLEFEETILNVNGQLLCRGIIATPILAEPFEVNLSTPSSPKPAHTTNQCNTTFPPRPITNPITGLIIHPIPLASTSAPPLTPLYTAVRLSATATNPQWTESNLPDGHPPPQWLTNIQNLITRSIPLGQAGHEGDPTAEAEEDGEDGILRGPPDDDDDDNNNKKGKKSAAGGDDDDSDQDDDNNEDEQEDEDANFDPWANEGPDVHPHRMRLWGLARSPGSGAGGGCTAVLATPLLTQRPMRGAWGAHRSRVLFGWQALAGKHSGVKGREEHRSSSSSTTTTTTTTTAGLTTEARLWEWMYGNGPGIPGLTPPLLLHTGTESAPTKTPVTHAQEKPDDDDHDPDSIAQQQQRARVREIMRPFATTQTCTICDPSANSKLTPLLPPPPPPSPLLLDNNSAKSNGNGRRVLDAICAQGHRVAVCGVTGLAIMAPGISRACAVCQSRCLGLEYLLDKVLLGTAAAKVEAEVEVVKEVMGRAVCARCGGKYLD